MRIMFLLAAVLVIAGAATASAKEAAWKPLFDGKSLKGWTPKIRGYPLGVVAQVLAPLLS